MGQNRRGGPGQVVGGAAPYDENLAKIRSLQKVLQRRLSGGKAFQRCAPGFRLTDNLLPGVRVFCH